MKLAVLLLLGLATSATAQAAPRVATGMPKPELDALEKIRRDVWVNWFAGDTAALHRVLGPELVAITADSPHWGSLEQNLAGSALFKASGAKLTGVRFDSTMVHRFGDVVVMFSHYAIDIDRGGEKTTQRGRATEVFVRSNGRWVHTSWHLDKVP